MRRERENQKKSVEGRQKSWWREERQTERERERQRERETETERFFLIFEKTLYLHFFHYNISLKIKCFKKSNWLK